PREYGVIATRISRLQRIRDWKVCRVRPPRQMHVPRPVRHDPEGILVAFYLAPDRSHGQTRDEGLHQGRSARLDQVANVAVSDPEMPRKSSRRRWYWTRATLQISTCTSRLLELQV